MAKGKRGPKFTIAEIQSLLKVIDEILPIGNLEWERVWGRHLSCYLWWERTVELLRCKFQQLACKKMPRGDLNCPHYICSSKHIYRKIVRATDGLDGGSDDEEDLEGDDADNNNNEDNNNVEKGEGERGDNDDDNGYDKGEYVGEQGEDYEGNIDPANLFGAAIKSVLAVATTRTLRAGFTSSSATTSGSKWSSSENLNRAGEKSKKSRGFRQPLWIPRRSPTSESNEGDGDGFSFNRMMSMMMMQQLMESEQRERQYRNESEQWERDY
jgi:hypothetical protein